jgi:integration host factor subunit beta
MNKSDLIEALSKDTGLPIVKTEEVVRTLLNRMANALTDGDRVEIRGFGSLKVKHYDGTMAKTLKQANLSR